MGSSKKHKEKHRDREDGDKKSHKSRDVSGKKRKHKESESDLLSPPPHQSPPNDKIRKRKHKEKKRHGEESEDSDAPVQKTSRYEARSPSPEKQGDGSNLSIHETNKLRAKLGLKPLQVQSSGPRPPPQRPSQGPVEEGEAEEEFDAETLQRIREEREKEGETFWKEEQEFVHAPAENLTAKLKSDKLRDKITALQEKRKIESKLLVAKGLADSDEEEDATAWVVKQKSRAEQKALAAKRAKELDDMDNEFGVGEVVEAEFVKRKNKAYTDKDLKGMKVMHDQSRIKEGSQVILTLKDKGVLDEEDDTLVNVNMLDDERFDKNVKNKQARPEMHGYNALDEVEYDDDGNLMTKNLLDKYDEEISGPAHQSFVIGQNISEEARKAQIRNKMIRADKILESVESASLKIASDFYTQDEMVSFKKPKKKVRKIRKVLRADDLLKLDTEVKKPAEGVINQRDLSNRNSKFASSTAVKDEPTDMEIDLEIDDFPAVTDVDISDVKLEDEADIDFQRALHNTRKMKQKETAKPRPKPNIAELLIRDLEEQPDQGNSSYIVLNSTAEFCRTLGDIPSVDTLGDLYGDEEMDFEQEEKHKSIPEERGAWNEVDIDETPVDIARIPEQEEVAILEQEPDVGVGLAGALKLAQKKGFLEQEKLKRPGAGTMKHLQAQNYTIEDKNYEEERIGKRDMYSGPTSDFREKESYKPNVKLEYNDEDGKPISAKEAFRLLSHKFHGKGSGKNKIDKKRKKTEQEKLMQHMNSTDTPLKTVELLRQKQKETHSPFLILSGSKAHNMLSKTGKR